jgi:hypothetical protein
LIWVTALLTVSVAGYSRCEKQSFALNEISTVALDKHLTEADHQHQACTPRLKHITSGGNAMPGWLIAVLKWGGIALSLFTAISLIFIQGMPFLDSRVIPIVPIWLYWVLTVIGLAAGIFGVAQDRRAAGRWHQ